MSLSLRTYLNLVWLLEKDVEEFCGFELARGACFIYSLVRLKSLINLFEEIRSKD